MVYCIEGNQDKEVEVFHLDTGASWLVDLHFRADLLGQCVALWRDSTLVCLRKDMIFTYNLQISRSQVVCKTGYYDCSLQEIGYY